MPVVQESCLSNLVTDTLVMPADAALQGQAAVPRLRARLSMLGVEALHGSMLRWMLCLGMSSLETKVKQPSAVS